MYFVNSEDPDEMAHKVAFHQRLHCFLRRKQFSGTEMHHFIERLTGTTFEYKIDQSKHIVSLCIGYSIRGIDDARHSLFVKAKRDLEVLPPNHGAFELHITRANYQAKIWPQADHVIMDLENKPTESIDLW